MGLNFDQFWFLPVPYTYIRTFYLAHNYSHGQELFYKFVSKITNKLVKQLLSLTVRVEFVANVSSILNTWEAISKFMKMKNPIDVVPVIDNLTAFQIRKAMKWGIS